MSTLTATETMSVPPINQTALDFTARDHAGNDSISRVDRKWLGDSFLSSERFYACLCDGARCYGEARPGVC